MPTEHLARFDSRARPSGARSFAWLLSVLALANSAPAQTSASGATLSESEAVARALKRAPLTDALEGAAIVEEGRAQSAGAYPNPQLSYTREQTFGSFGTTENYLSLSQTIDLGNRRGLHARAGALRAKAARKEGAAARLSVAADARQRFYDVLYRKLRVKALQTWTVHVAEALAIVTRREQRGDTAKYDRRRLERELAMATGRVAAEEATFERAQGRLAAILGEPSSPRHVTGALLPDFEPPTTRTLRASSASRPDFVALGLLSQATALDSKAASRWWLPELRLEGGWKGVDLGANRRTDGFLAGASISIPLWDQSRGLTRIAEGEARSARGRRALLESELESELGGARAETLQLRRAASEFRERTHSASNDLMHMASVGYEAGELAILELLDAYRGAAEDELTALDMEGAARRARIELDRLTGASVP